jgi:hypothetical protein
VVVQLRHRPRRGARGAHRIGLVDGDDGGNPLDALRLRLVHPVEELAGIGREGLHIAPLSLGVDGVEGERGLARAADPSHHDQLAERRLHIQAILAGAADEYGMAAQAEMSER